MSVNTYDASFILALCIGIVFAVSDGGGADTVFAFANIVVGNRRNSTDLITVVVSVALGIYVVLS